MQVHARYGPSAPPSLITVESILNSDLLNPPPADPFEYVLDAVRRDMYNDHHRLRVAGEVFSAVLGVSFYKLLPTPRGTFIMPNVIQIWLLANIFYAIFSFPYLWRQILIDHGSLYSAQIWIALNWIPVFSGLWNVAWGTAVSAQLATSQLSSADNSSRRCRPLFLPPMLLNLWFPVVWLAGVVTMAATFGVTTATWNRGATNWGALQAELVRAQELNAGKAGGAETVLNAVPDANERLAEMTKAWWTFQMPWIVCLTFSAITAATMALSAAIQLRMLVEQISIIDADLRAADRRSTSSSGGGERVPSESSSRTNSLTRKAGLRKVLIKVILTTLALSLSLLGYVGSCIAGQIVTNETKLFHRYKSPKTHVYALTFVYSSLSLIVVILIILQSLDPTVLQTKVESNERASAAERGGDPASPTTPGVTKRPMSASNFSEPFSSAEYASTLGAKDEYELATSPTTIQSPRSPIAAAGEVGPRGGTYTPPLSPSTPASVRLTHERDQSRGRSEVTHESWQRVQGRKPVPEV